jgi:hypothetical protein
MVEKLQKQSRLTRAAVAKKDADTILKALRNISSLCDVFQVSFLSYRQYLRVDIDLFKDRYPAEHRGNSRRNIGGTVLLLSPEKWMTLIEHTCSTWTLVR